MGKRWAEQPPYPNWKGYAPSLTTYAQQRLDTAELPPDASFGKWFAEHEASLRKASTQRDKNLIVARQLLPVSRNYVPPARPTAGRPEWLTA